MGGHSQNAAANVQACKASRRRVVACGVLGEDEVEEVVLVEEEKEDAGADEGCDGEGEEKYDDEVGEMGLARAWSTWRKDTGVPVASSMATRP